MKRILLFIILISLILTFFQFNTVSVDEGYEMDYVIGVSQCNLGEPWRIKMNEDIINEASKYDNIQLVLLDAAQNNDKQIEDIQTLLKLGVDLMIISPNEAEPLTKAVNEANDQVPVILLDRNISNDGYTLFIGADNYTIGEQIGHYIIEQSKDQKVTILEIKGLAGSAPTVARSEGFYNAIAPYNNLKIVKSIEADWLRDKAENELSNDLLLNVDYIYAHNDPMALGAYYAYQKEKSLPVFIGIDGLGGAEGGLSLVKKGILDSTFTYPTGGQEAIEYALKILNKETIEEKNIPLNSIHITSENINAYLKDYDISY
jgi:ABC-type sugar transport system substrate-binding protein